MKNKKTSNGTSSATSSENSDASGDTFTNQLFETSIAYKNLERQINNQGISKTIKELKNSLRIDYTEMPTRGVEPPTY